MHDHIPEDSPDESHDIDELDEFEEIERESEELDRFQIQPRRVRGPGRQEVNVLHEDDHLIVIDKPAGLDSTRGQYSIESVFDRLEGMYPDRTEPFRLVHRLDRDASGVMVLAGNVDIQRELTRQWSLRQVEKTYVAVVNGVVQPPEGTIDFPLSKTKRKKAPVVVSRSGSKSVTEYEVLEQFREYAFVQASPVTGRMHQIRVHFAAAGMPIVCDPHYGAGRAVYLSQFKRKYNRPRRHEERPLIDRLALHSKRVAFTHPATNEPLTVESDLPKDIRRTVAQLGKFGR